MRGSEVPSQGASARRPEPKSGNRAGSTVSGLPTARFEEAADAVETLDLLRGVGGVFGGFASPGEAGGVAIARDEISFFLHKSNRPLPGFVPRTEDLKDRGKQHLRGEQTTALGETTTQMVEGV